MAPKKASEKVKRKKKVHMTSEMKREICAMRDSGVRVCLATKYGKSQSMIRTILKQKQGLFPADGAKGLKAPSRQHTKNTVKVEQSLMAGINGKQLMDDSVEVINLAEEIPKDVSSAEIKKMCDMWDEISPW